MSFASGLNFMLDANNCGTLGTLNALKFTLLVLTYPAFGNGLNLLSVIPIALTLDVVFHNSSVFKVSYLDS